jgi:hypothetical protein
LRRCCLALTDLQPAGTVFAPARFARTGSGAVPYDAIARLSALRGEAGRTMRSLQLLARSPQACLILMLAGAVALAWTSQTAGGVTLTSEFCWALSVLIGIVAMTANYIRGYAMRPRSVKLQQAASDLRLLLLYTGAAWGAGAFLVMPDQPPPTLVLAFATGPSLALGLLLKDAKGTAAFGAPVTLACAGAALLGAPALAAALLVAGLLTCCLPMLQGAMVAHPLPDLSSH